LQDLPNDLFCLFAPAPQPRYIALTQAELLTPDVA
jgi:hypothetical protein